MFEMRLVSSLYRVFPEKCPSKQIGYLSAAANEPVSFQAAFRLRGDTSKAMMVNVRSKSALPVSTYLVGCVPVMHTDTAGIAKAHAPGLFPDMLLRKRTDPPLIREGAPWGLKYYEKGEEHLLHAGNDAWQAVWFTLNEDGETLPPGDYAVKILFESAEDRSVLASKTLTVRVLPTSLLPQKLIYTNWFHCDCLADYYRVRIFSDRFFRIFENYVRTAARHGMNMLLLPAFTPPLDTPIGGERMTAQLVKVRLDGGQYSFDFSLMKKYIDIARGAGITHFEHSHLFTQWGAKAAPKIIAEVNGHTKRIFGWDTDAAGEQYRAFLRAYLPEVTAFLRAEGLEKKTLFHLSDEPGEGMEDGYRKAKEAVGDMLDGFMLGDALSHYSYYEKGLTDLPICVTRDIGTFIGRCEHLWAYYTGGQVQDGLSNRVIALPPERNRILGTELYANRIEGFLQWGYNYYYDMLSHGLFDPKTNPCGYNHTAGSCYAVYPGRNGEAIPSASQKVFYEGINDMRALETLESMKGRGACEALTEKHFGQVDFHVDPGSPEKMLNFREDVNRAMMR